MSRPARNGCTSCGSPDTVTIDAVHGRRCVACPPTFDPTYAVELARRGAVATAMAYVRTPLGGEL